jgi:small-conductance mechanosensitive channel
MSDKEARSPGQIRSDIDQTREELGETVAAVADKADVKKQAQAKADELKGQAGEKAGQAKEKAKALGGKAKQMAPDSAGEGVQQAQQLAQKNPVPLAIVGAFLAGFVLSRILSR